MIYYKYDRQGSNAVIIPLHIYKNLRIIAKFLDLTVLKNSIVVYMSIKIYKLPKFFMH
jgi:hypothetical protein